MATLLSAFLGLAVLVSAVAVLAARRLLHAGIALGANGLLLAIISAWLGATLVAVTWALLGTSMICTALVVRGHRGQGSAPSSKLLVLGVVLFSAAMLLGGLLVQYAPGQVGVDVPLATSAEFEGGLAVLLSVDYAPSAVAIALIVAATLVGIRLYGGES